MLEHKRPLRLRTSLAVLVAAALIVLPPFARADGARSSKNGQELADLLSQLHETDSSEIALGRLAEEKGSAPVQAFGKTLVRDHKQADQEIASLAKDKGVELSPPAPENSKEQAQDARADQLKANLEQARGKDFDRKFLEAMANEHAHDIRMVELEMNNVGDDQVRKVFGDILPKLEQHHDTAVRLLKTEMGQTTTPGVPGFQPGKPAI